MTHKDRETIQRALGIIEGVMFFVNGDAIEALDSALDMINEVLGVGEEMRK